MKLSFVIPFFRKATLFREMLPFTRAFTAGATEVVCVLDEPSDLPEVLKIASEYRSKIRMRVIVNTDAHAWRLPCMALNVGIRNALGDKIAIISPETCLQLPCDDYLETCGPNNGFTTGLLWCLHKRPATRSLIALTTGTKSPDSWGYGFIMAKRSAFETLCGYDESATEYGEDDCGIRLRLLRAGYYGICDPAIHAFHMGHDGMGNIGPRHEQPPITPNATLPHQKDWGRAFSTVAWDWTKI